LARVREQLNHHSVCRRGALVSSIARRVGAAYVGFFEAGHMKLIQSQELRKMTEQAKRISGINQPEASLGPVFGGIE
jgi:hypothetical protein